MWKKQDGMNRIELHMIHNINPSLLNRDRNGRPKTCTFGGHTRTRISSQCQKRAIRSLWDQAGYLENWRAVRTREIPVHISKMLEEEGYDRDQVIASVRGILHALINIKPKSDTESTSYALFVGKNNIETLTQVLRDHWETIAKLTERWQQQAKDGKKEHEKLPANIEEALAGFFSSANAADLALFGRMIADAPTHNIDSAVQVAHAMSTHTAKIEVDHFAAVDDLMDPPSSYHIADQEYHSSVFYRYLVLDPNTLVKNLHYDRSLMKEVIEAYLYGAIMALPSGKQNSFAAHNPPIFVLGTADGGVAWSLNDAFHRPVCAEAGETIVEKSIMAMLEYRQKLQHVYGRANKSHYITLLDDLPVISPEEATQEATKKDKKDKPVSQKCVVLDAQKADTVEELVARLSAEVDG